MFDLIIAGGGTSGVAAAYTAGKLGLKVLLVEKKEYLGGEMTGGLVVPMMNSGESSINRDFFNDLVAEMAKNSAQIEFQGNKGWFNPHVLKSVLLKMLENKGVFIAMNTQIAEIKHDLASNITSVKLNSNPSSHIILSEYNKSIYSDNIPSEKMRLSEYIEARYIIDATGNCEIGKICNCNFLENKSGENQLVSLRFCMSGVDVGKFAAFLREQDANTDVSPIEIINGKTHLSTAFTWDKREEWGLYSLFKKAVDAGDISPDDCNYFQIFTVAGSDGEIAFNCPRYPRIIDTLDPEALSSAYNYLKQSLESISYFCKKYMPGFENAYVSAVADGIGIRCSRRILGKYVYTENDLKSSKTFDNPVLVSNYPIDVHKVGENSGVEKVFKSYELPIESLMSADINNLFVVGRCLSADFKAQSALRVQQSCFSMGEGVAKYIARVINNE